MHVLVLVHEKCIEYIDVPAHRGGTPFYTFKFSSSHHHFNFGLASVEYKLKLKCVCVYT